MDDEDHAVAMKAEAGLVPDWTEEGTMIVRIARPNNLHLEPGQEPVRDQFGSPKNAMRHFEAKYGRVYQNLSTARFWAARVRRPV